MVSPFASEAAERRGASTSDHFIDGAEVSPFDAASALNEMPIPHLGYMSPSEAFRGLGSEQPTSGNGQETNRDDER